MPARRSRRASPRRSAATATCWRPILPAAEPLLAVTGLCAAYGKKQIRRGVDFTTGRGETVTLLGANGSGKSTCLNAISGFVRPDAGTIMLEDKPIAGIPIHRIFRA